MRITRSIPRFSALLAIFLITGFSMAADKPNVLFIVSDDLNTDLATYGHPLVHTPNLDRLAQRGMRFTNAHCQVSLCGPSRGSFMTGLYPEQNGIVNNSRRVRDNLPYAVTLPQHFMNHGYRTARISKIFHMGIPNGIGGPGKDDPASWHTALNPRGWEKDNLDQVHTLEEGQFGATLSWLAVDDALASQQTDAMTATEAVNLLRDFAQQDAPFFLAVGLVRPHTPFIAPISIFDQYDRSAISVPTVPPGYEETIPSEALRTMGHPEDDNLDPALAREIIEAYYASITFFDIQIGVILDELDALNLTNDTIIVFISDHGYHLGEHGHYQKTTLFERALKVPMIVVVPGMENAGETTHAPAELTDLYRTLSDLAGLPEPSNIMGVSLAPVLDDPSLRPRQNALSMWKDNYSLRDERYRYTRWGNGGPGNIELYDFQTDPQGMNNLAEDPEQQERIQQMDAALDARLEQIVPMPPPDSDADDLPDSWEGSYYQNPQLHDALSDPNHDGKPVLVDFAEGADPLRRAPSVQEVFRQLPSPDNSHQVMLRYHRNTWATNLLHQIYQSTNLIDWSPLDFSGAPEYQATETVLEEHSTDTANVEMVEVLVQLPVSTQQMFFQRRVVNDNRN